MRETRDDVPTREQGDAEDGGPARQLTTDELFHTLQDERRRLVLRDLLDRSEATTVRSLTERVAARERGADDEGLADEQLQRVYIDLYQTHLPKLDDLGLVAYERSRGEVEPTGAVSLLESHLDLESGTGTGEAAEDTPAGTDDGTGTSREPASARPTVGGPVDGLDWRHVHGVATAVGLALAAFAWVGPFGALAVSFRTATVVLVGLQVALTTGLFLSRGR